MVRNVITSFNPVLDRFATLDDKNYYIIRNNERNRLFWQKTKEAKRFISGRDDENPKLCFEVEHTTDIVHGLNRLAQLQHLYSKFFIVATEDRRGKFNIEMQKYPFRGMKDRFGFISYDELVALYETALPFYELKTKLLGKIIVHR